MGSSKVRKKIQPTQEMEMKKVQGLRGFTLVELVLVVLIIGFVAQSPVQGAEFPFVKSLTLPGGGTNVVRWAYTNGVNRDVYSTFRITSFEVSANAAIDNTGTVRVYRIRSSRTNELYTPVSVASSGVFGISYPNPSNIIWNFRNDAFLFVASFTNAGTIEPVGVEQ
jgi:prepilin-type N-terminal cleavage/methylation domain-containing protein